VDLIAFSRAAAQGRVPPVALLHGPEPLLLEDGVQAVTRALFPDPAGAALSREVLDARQAGAEAVVRSAETLPFLTARRLVVVRGAEALTRKQAAPLQAYLRAPSPCTVLLLVAEALERGHWLLEAVPAAAVVEAQPPRGRALPGWLRRRAAEAGLEVTEGAAALLVELAGEDLGGLLAEAEKAALSGGPDNRRVTEAHVRALVGAHRRHRVFELARALERREAGQALALLTRLLDEGEDPHGVLGWVTREVRALAQVRSWLDQDRHPAEIGRDLRRPEPAVAALVRAAQALAAGGAARRLERCWQAERRLKSGTPARAELALLVADLCE
jgi:DNA polymerase III delta subunit